MAAVHPTDVPFGHIFKNRRILRDVGRRPDLNAPFYRWHCFGLQPEVRVGCGFRSLKNVPGEGRERSRAYGLTLCAVFRENPADIPTQMVFDLGAGLQAALK